MPSRSSSAVAAVPRPATLRSLAPHASGHWIGRAANPGDGYDRRGAESTWRHMRPLIVEVPSPLGLRPSGVELALEVLRAAGLHSLLGCDDAQHVAVPAYDARRDEATGVLNPDGIAEVARSLAGVVDSALQADRLPVVLGGDCSIILGPLLALRRRGRYGLAFLDGHADFQHPCEEPNGEVASLDLAVATGRGPGVLADVDGLRPLVRDGDVALIGYRVVDDNDPFLAEHIRST